MQCAYFLSKTLKTTFQLKQKKRIISAQFLKKKASKQKHPEDWHAICMSNIIRD